MRTHLTIVVALALAACSRSADNPPAANVAPAAPVAALAPAEPPSLNVTLSSNPADPVADSRSTVEIKFQRGANCWRYVGAAATFNGKFAAGQRLDVTSTGEQANGDGRSTWYETRPRNIDVAAPGGQLLTTDSDGYFDVPAAGTYQISYDPMSMVGAPGVMIVCTR